MDLNLFERSIASVNPGWGVQRLSAKVGLAQAREAARGFDAARRDRRTDSWRATGGSANAELAPALSLIIRRSRDLCRNNEWVVNSRRKYPAYIVGTGITPRPDAPAKGAKQIARDAWESFSDNCDPEGLMDFYGKQTQAVGEAFEGGASFIRWYVRPKDFGLKVPLQCEVLEHEFLDTQKTEILSGGKGNVVVHGVEYDNYGRRVAYWLFPVHPGEVSMIRRTSFQSQRVPAGEVDHVFRVDRPGQVTGVPWTAPTMLRLRDSADYEEAELVRKKIEACFTVFVRRTNGGTGGVAQAIDQSVDAKNRKLEKIAPGMIAYVESDGEVTTASPNSTGDGGHMERQQYAFAAGIGLPFANVTGNLTKVNFSSLREGKLDFWATLDQLQWNMMIPQVCRPAWQRVMRISSAVGLQVSPDIKAKWAMPKRPWVNPVDDMKAEAGELALGLESWAEKVASRGYDPEELIEEIGQWQAKLTAAGLSVGAAPGIAGLTAGNPPGDNTAKPKDSNNDNKDDSEA
jgi:lambda family phage portal protein